MAASVSFGVVGARHLIVQSSNRGERTFTGVGWIGLEAGALTVLKRGGAVLIALLVVVSLFFALHSGDVQSTCLLTNDIVGLIFGAFLAVWLAEVLRRDPTGRLWNRPDRSGCIPYGLVRD